jgi:hypothetical protein
MLRDSPSAITSRAIIVAIRSSPWPLLKKSTIFRTLRVNPPLNN